MKEIDAKGLDCPEPVILAKKALQNEKEIFVSVDNKTAVENLKRLGNKLNCKIEIDSKSDTEFVLHFISENMADVQNSEERSSVKVNPAFTGSIIVFSDDKMGRGDDDLGEVLMKAYVYTLLELDDLPETCLFYNSGVKLLSNDSDVIDDFIALEAKGVELLICGTCADFFNISDNINAGKISNMYDIASVMSTARSVIKP